MLDLHLIRIDGGTQSRAKLNNDVVAEYVEAYKAGAKFPAVTVFYDGKDRWLADGFHRYHAAKQAGKKTIFENIIPGTLRDAKFHSWKANQEHGQRRTNDDKRNIVLEVLADEEAGKWSDNHIAKEFGFAQSFVSKLRLSLNSEISEKPTERTYTTKQGTTATMQTSGIGKAKPVTAIPATPAAKPAHVEPEDNDYSGPSDSELAEAEALAKADIDKVMALLESDDPKAALLQENERQRMEIATLKSQRDGYMNQCNELIRRVKSLRKMLDKAQGK